jgi:hypothetical protein
MSPLCVLSAGDRLAHMGHRGIVIYSSPLSSQQSDNEVIPRVIEAVAAGRWDNVKLLLHPYLHWTQEDGLTRRGRSNVLRWLPSRQRALAPPARFELRDGQVYRWIARA